MKSLLLVLSLAACQIPAPHAPYSPIDARDATFKVETDSGSGTAWIVDTNANRSLLVTAGHVCRDEENFKLVASDGMSTYALKVKQHAKYDLCVLMAVPLGPALELSPVAPVYDEPVMAVGAPLGVYACTGGSSVDACGMAPISRGHFAGGNLVSMPMAGGNSGSAVFTQWGVIGVLVERYRGFDSLSFIEPAAHIVELLDSI